LLIISVKYTSGRYILPVEYIQNTHKVKALDRSFHVYSGEHWFKNRSFCFNSANFFALSLLSIQGVP